MADEPTSQPQGTTPEAPAAVSSAPESTHAVTEWAKAEAAKLDQPQASEASPAPATPDSEAKPTEAPAEGDAGPEDKPGSRRERGEELRAQIERDVRAKFEQEQRANQTAHQQEQAQRDWDALLSRANSGDVAAGQQLAGLLSQSRTTQTAVQQGRNAVLTEMGADIVKTVTGLTEADDAARDALMKAPTLGEFGKQAFEHGQRLAKATADARIATLEAEVTSLKGKLAASGPSPLPSNGANGRGTALPAGSDMRTIAAQVAAEMGISL